MEQGPPPALQTASTRQMHRGGQGQAWLGCGLELRGKDRRPRDSRGYRGRGPTRTLSSCLRLDPPPPFSPSSPHCTWAISRKSLYSLRGLTSMTQMTSTFSGCKDLMKATDLVFRTKKAPFSLFAQKFMENFEAAGSQWEPGPEDR